MLPPAEKLQNFFGVFLQFHIGVDTDDDQHTLGLALLSGRSELDVCHITLLDMADAADFFAFHSGDYEVKHFYSGGWS